MTQLVRFDWAMKYLLRNKANFDILEGFLSELLKTDITIESLLESEGNKNVADDKHNRVDLMVRTSQQERILIEVQTVKEWDFLTRILYGTSKVVTEYIKEGAPYRDVCKVISVNIIFFNLGQGNDYLYRGRTEFRGMHLNDVLKLGPNEREVYPHAERPAEVFPEYYLIRVDHFNDRIKSKFDEWVYFLKTEQVNPDFDAKGLQSAAEKLNVLKLSDADRADYVRYQDNMHYQASLVLTSQIEQKKYINQGREEGRKEGHLESQKIIAQKMKAQGFDNETIATITGLADSTLTEID